MNGPEVSSTDILRLFREDLTLGDRVDAFKHAADQLRDEVNILATERNVSRINKNFDTTFIFNNHGDGTDAGQSTALLEKPFITFVENAGDEDIAKSAYFALSADNAFNIRFNTSQPTQVPFALTRENGWSYWRDRGLLTRGSIIAPIDIRHYSRRLLDALMGSDYDQNYLNSSIPVNELKNSSFDELLEQQKQKGLLIMHSNAVRELTSTKQVLGTLLGCLDTEKGKTSFEAGVSDKIRAIMQKDRMISKKLPVYIIYGSGHHTVSHLFNRLGLNVAREFPGSQDIPGRFKQLGKVKDQFFAAHPFGLTDEQVEKYAKQHILESILWAPLDMPADYDMIPESDQTMLFFWNKLNYAARRPELVESIKDIFESYQKDPHVPVKILHDHGIKLRSIGATVLSET